MTPGCPTVSDSFVLLPESSLVSLSVEGFSKKVLEFFDILTGPYLEQYSSSPGNQKTVPGIQPIIHIYEIYSDLLSSLEKIISHPQTSDHRREVGNIFSSWKCGTKKSVQDVIEYRGYNPQEYIILILKCLGMNDRVISPIIGELTDYQIFSAVNHRGLSSRFGKSHQKGEKEILPISYGWRQNLEKTLSLPERKKELIGEINTIQGSIRILSNFSQEIVRFQYEISTIGSQALPSLTDHPYYGQYIGMLKLLTRENELLKEKKSIIQYLQELLHYHENLGGNKTIINTLDPKRQKRVAAKIKSTETEIGSAEIFDQELSKLTTITTELENICLVLSGYQGWTLRHIESNESESSRRFQLERALGSRINEGELRSFLECKIVSALRTLPSFTSFSALLEEYERLKTQYTTLSTSIKDLATLVRETESTTQLSVYKDQIREYGGELDVLAHKLSDLESQISPGFNQPWEKNTRDSLYNTQR